MSALVIETSGLRKEYTSRRGGRRVAVQGLDLAVPAGGVHGFLGPNGSGKTTTIRMLLGLSRATAGSMRLFGEEVPRRLPGVIGRVGAVVESPKFSPHLTGRQNLLLLARSISAPDARVDAAVETVGLTGRDADRFRSYSLGMKQRLAIAATLLKDPDLLILDEPTNGLDPAGIREVRDTIRDLGAAGVTVLLSSHILAEVQQVCTSATIIGNGRLLASGTVDELLAGATTHRVVVPDPATAARVLRAAGLTVTGPAPTGPAPTDSLSGPGAPGTPDPGAPDPGLTGPGQPAPPRHAATEHHPGHGAPPGDPDADRALTVETDDPAAITRALAEAGVWLTELAPVRQDLESYFLALTADDTLGGR